MTSANQVNASIIFEYELKRKSLISEIKKKYGLKLNDFIFLHHLSTCDSNRIPLNEVKKSLTFSLMEIHKSLTALTENQIIGKERSLEDERKVFITITEKQNKHMHKLLDEFDALIQDIMNENQ
ncbi:transcriptional regulator, SarA/Rot family [Staphylococcus massiliensis]|uniref:Accessory regulator family protein n=1 Tax=Staphylococcus massiliensis S46 TaxID=1229783 RepID=K9AXW0_9STAP|nr:accessory regulator family protein [Staphylococcus massiliensis]EKU46350.1 accessory regulator family protein [Staphylococcus massiliensis S46]MCG3398669.1 regulator [Staphylococcus massiliensis]MCG3401231.1 regulator [Staphylococcus massiliensis]MCG3412592.1 regulator [Staphylococcus massiliensis]PNZ98847.1 regulator [Staphylococcus massiliensis CCUG 55927]